VATRHNLGTSTSIQDNVTSIQHRQAMNDKVILRACLHMMKGGKGSNKVDIEKFIDEIEKSIK